MRQIKQLPVASICQKKFNYLTSSSIHEGGSITCPSGPDASCKIHNKWSNIQLKHSIHHQLWFKLISLGPLSDSCLLWRPETGAETGLLHGSSSPPALALLTCSLRERSLHCVWDKLEAELWGELWESPSAAHKAKFYNARCHGRKSWGCEVAFREGDKSGPRHNWTCLHVRTTQPAIYSLYPNITYLDGESLEIKMQISVQLYKSVNWNRICSVVLNTS